MSKKLAATLTIVISVNVMGGLIAFVLNSIDIMQWPWIARALLVFWGLYTVYFLLTNEID